MILKEGRVMKGCVCSQESLPYRPAPPAPNKVADIDRAALLEIFRDITREAAIEECAKALEADAKRCDCFARNEGECGCGAWCEWKSITSARAIEIVRKLKNVPPPESDGY